MPMKKCDYCNQEVPVNGQCNRCGFVDGFRRQPTDDEFKHARKINEENDYKQFKNLDMLLID